MAPTGLEAQATLRMEMGGSDVGDAYAAANRTRNDELLRCSGHSSTVDATPGSESVTYAPISDPASLESGSFIFYGDGKKWPVAGVYSDFSFEIDVSGSSFAVAEFAIRGIGTLPTDIAVPTITYPTALAPRAQNISFSINAFTTGVIRRVAFSKNLGLLSRGDLNATDGFAGAAVGRRGPELVIEMEKTALSGFNPYTLWDAATQMVISFTVGLSGGPGQFERFTFNMPQAQIVNVEEGEEEPVALWTLTCRVPVSAGGLDDDYTLVYD